MGACIVPIRGTKRRRYLDENVAAADIILSSGDLRALRDAVDRPSVVSARYTEEGMKG